jgi:hypothetical protein
MQSSSHKTKSIAPCFFGRTSDIQGSFMQIALVTKLELIGIKKLFCNSLALFGMEYRNVEGKEKDKRKDLTIHCGGLIEKMEM